MRSDGKTRRIGLTVLLSVLVAACASDGRQVASDDSLTRTRVALLAANDADSLAAAVELAQRPGNIHSRQFALLTRAATLAPGRADLVWLEIEACADIDTCDPAPLAETLHRLDPENGAAWASLLDAASKRGDVAATNRYLDAIASSKRFDIYWNTSIARLTAAVLKSHTLDASTALVALTGAEAAFGIPAYHDISEACKPPATQVVGRLSACRRIAAVMRSGDTYITEMLGISIAQRVWPEDSAEFTSAVAERRLAHYRMRMEGPITVSSLRTNADAMEYLKLLSTHRAEQEVALAVIEGAGKSPTPSADWKEPATGGS